MSTKIIFNKGSIKFNDNSKELALINTDTTGNINVNHSKLINISKPTNNNDCVNKIYTDNEIQKNTTSLITMLSTTNDIQNSIANFNYIKTGGISLSGQITGNLSNKMDHLYIDNTLLNESNNGLRMLIKNQIDKTQNGIFSLYINNKNIILNRTIDFDNEDDIKPNIEIYVKNGLNNKKTTWFLEKNELFIVGGNFGSEINFIKKSIECIKNGILINGEYSALQILSNINQIELSTINKKSNNNIDLKLETNKNGKIILNDLIMPTTNGKSGDMLFTDGKQLYFDNKSEYKIIEIITENETPVQLFDFLTEINKSYLLDIYLFYSDKLNVNVSCHFNKILLKNTNNIITIIGQLKSQIFDDNFRHNYIIEVINDHVMINVTGSATENIIWKINYKIFYL
jgi:hypothetical protein